MPDWFKLEKYALSNELDAAGWYEQLLIREGLISTITSPDEASQFELEIFHETPIADIKSNIWLSSLCYDLVLQELKTRTPRYSLGVHRTTVRLHYYKEGSIEEEKRTYARNYFNQDYDDVDYDGDGLTVPLKYEHQDWIDEPIDNITCRDDRSVNVTVNMLLPDKVLVDQFKQMLNEIRSPLKKTGITIENTMKQSYKNWVRFGVLPFLDLRTGRFHLTTPRRSTGDGKIAGSDFTDDIRAIRLACSSLTLISGLCALSAACRRN